MNCSRPRRRSFVLLRALLAGVIVATGCERGRPISTPLPETVALSKGTCPIIHCNTWQTGALALKGPEAPSGRINPNTLDHLWSSPIAGGILDFSYPDGRTIFWVPQVDRIMKLELDESDDLVKIAELPIEPKNFPRRSPEEMQAIVAQLDAAALGSEAHDALAQEWMDYQLEGLRAYYAMVNDQGILYVGNRSSVIAYTDAEPGNPESGIVKAGQFVFSKLQLQLGLKMPLVIMIGINTTPDGHLVTVTIDGTVIAIEPDLSEGHYYNLEGEQIWNSLSVDDDGGIYVAGTKRMHKLIWTGNGFSDREEDGAWSLPYAVGELDAGLRAERGTGTTPALMGSETDADQFVVVADAADVNNLMLLWRDDIPDDWEQLPGTLRRHLRVRSGARQQPGKDRRSHANAGAAQDEGSGPHSLRPAEVPLEPGEPRVRGGLDPRRRIESQQHTGGRHGESAAARRGIERRPVGNGSAGLGHRSHESGLQPGRERALQPDHAGASDSPQRRPDLRQLRGHHPPEAGGTRDLPPLARMSQRVVTARNGRRSSS
jgi:hypothetical protein